MVSDKSLILTMNIEQLYIAFQIIDFICQALNCAVVLSLLFLDDYSYILSL